MKQRDYSIDILKCLAAILITWSHMEPAFGGDKYSVLCTGGSFGDSLFFFCSGYTLFIGKDSLVFFNWYKKRIRRIYPTVFTWALIMAILLDQKNDMTTVVCGNGYFFIPCIMIFYLILYPIKRYLNKHLVLTIISVYCILASSYFMINISDTDISYAWTFSMFFLVMLCGAMVGKIKSETKKDTLLPNSKLPIITLFTSVISYYILMYLENAHIVPGFIVVINIITMLIFSVSIYEICNHYASYMNGRIRKTIIMIIGSLCLDIYFVQSPIINRMPMIDFFPINLIVLPLVILLIAYVLNCLSKVWGQTFSEGNYDLKKIIKLF